MLILSIKRLALLRFKYFYSLGASLTHAAINIFGAPVGVVLARGVSGLNAVFFGVGSCHMDMSLCNYNALFDFNFTLGSDYLA